MTTPLVMETTLCLFICILLLFWFDHVCNNTIRFPSWSLSFYSRLFMQTLSSLPVALTDLFFHHSLVMGEFVGRYTSQCFWSIISISSALGWAEWNFNLSASFNIIPYTCAALHPCFGYLSSKYLLYSTSVLVDFTEWFIAFFCFHDTLAHAWNFWWTLVHMHSSVIAISPSAFVVLGWTTCCSRAFLLPDTLVKVSGRFPCCYLLVHSTSAFQQRLGLQLATIHSISILFRFLSFVYGLRLGLVMSLFMAIKSRASLPTLKLSRFGARGIKVATLTCECADSHSWGLTISFWACRDGISLSSCLLGVPRGLSWLSGVHEDQTYLALISVQHQTQPEDACTRNGPNHCTFLLIWQHVCTLFFGVLSLPHIVTYLIY